MRPNYPHDDAYEADDPGNMLRHELNKFGDMPKDVARRVQTLLYTAGERNILESGGISFEDAMTVHRIIKLATEIDDDASSKMRM